MLGVKVSLRQIMLQSCRDGGDTGHWQPGSASSFRTVETVETATDSEELLLVVMTEEES